MVGFCGCLLFGWLFSLLFAVGLLILAAFWFSFTVVDLIASVGVFDSLFVGGDSDLLLFGDWLFGLVRALVLGGFVWLFACYDFGFVVVGLQCLVLV